MVGGGGGGTDGSKKIEEGFKEEIIMKEPIVIQRRGRVPGGKAFRQ